MNPILVPHIAGGLIAILAGTLAIAARKGGAWHASAGTWFVGAMLVLGVTASILEPLKTPPESPLGGILVCYFVTTSWMTARRRDGKAGRFEKIACAVILLIAIAMIAKGVELLSAPPGTIPGPFVLFALGGFCLLAGLLDLNYIFRGPLAPRQRLSRHLWRMCFAFFIATGSFFLGQQQVLPKAVQGSPLLFVVAFAPFAVMLFWLVRLRLPGMARRFPTKNAPAVRPGRGVD